MNKVGIVRKYFQQIADDYDSIYSERKDILRRFVDFVFRRSIRQRFAATFKECVDLSGKSVLDIGCGSGRYSIEFAKRGAQQVLGIDFSENMLSLARQRTEQNGFSRICRFTRADFLAYDFKEKFDISIVIGVLEYHQHPKVFLDKMKQLTQEKMIISLPVKWTLRSGLRKIRLSLKGCPVYFYTRQEIINLLASSQLKNYKIERFDRDYLVIIDSTS
ncbi:class I SAM-dependent methyltransferase [Candidatus Omnitrophota bacterium]